MGMGIHGKYTLKKKIYMVLLKETLKFFEKIAIVFFINKSLQTIQILKLCCGQNPVEIRSARSSYNFFVIKLCFHQGAP